MYTILSKFYGLVTTNVDVPTGASSHVLDGGSDSSTLQGCSSGSAEAETNSEYTTAAKQGENGAGKRDASENRFTKATFGEVTSIFSGRGLIEDHIYFSEDCVVGNERLQIGDKVSVEASRIGVHGGWVADRVTAVKEWDNDSESKETTSELLGMVTYFMRGSGMINEKYPFHKYSCQQGYNPIVNDFVQCEIKTTETSEEVIISVKPVREKEFVGTITDVINRYGFIDDDIYFHISSCINSYAPVKGDQVKVCAIESKQKRSHWRATKLEKLKTNFQCKPHSSDSSELSSKYIEFLLKPKNGVSVTRDINYGDTEIGCMSMQAVTVRFLGKYENIVIVDLGSFKLGCRVRANVYDPTERAMASNLAFSYRKSTNNDATRFDVNGRILPGQRPMRKKKMFLPKHLMQYDIPKTVKDCILNDGCLQNLIPEIMMPLSMNIYRRKLATLLYAEEITQEEEMRQFDMQMVTVRPLAEYFLLSVPGLAEGRPSLLVGSTVDSPKYEGCIHEVRAEDVLLKFNEAFHKMYRNEDCNVQFFFNRTVTRRRHQAVEHAANLGEDDISFVNKSLNERQKCAVRKILTAEGRPAPYVLFGPPGTGKTITVVEAILQVFSLIPTSRILACAPSNSASDLIAQRLVESSKFSKGQLIRLNAMQRSQDCHESLLPFCTSDTDDLMLSCRYRVVVCTCSMAGILYSAGLESGHFTHVFVDEAGQSTEPECLIPMGLVAGNENGQIILSGDPYQLGPVLNSPIAVEYGLSTSLLERIMSRPLYTRDESKFASSGCYNPLLVTKLISNYRSHPMLLNLSSSLFYHNELVPCATPDVTDSFINSSMLLTKDFPIIFHGIRVAKMKPNWTVATSELKIDIRATAKSMLSSIFQQRESARRERA
eukprot:gene5865-6558_t